ncbi:MAG: Pvc16 family protein, partial [Cyanobacteria bacterium J06659_2]
DLAEQLQQPQILPVDLELEEISKIWSAFFQTSYLLSMGYKVRVVMIDGMEPAERALPVRDRSFGRIMPFASQPVINEILPLTGKLAPILANSTLRIRGQQLSHAATTVRIGGVEVTPVTVSHREITLPLTIVPQHALHPGIQTLQVLHSQTAPIANNAGQLLAPIRSIVESNGTPFVLRPTITQLALTDVVGNEDDPRDATLQITLDLSVDPGQRVNIGLNEWTVQSPAVYFFDGPNRSETTAHLTIPLYNIRAGEYLVRVVVDGAESLLTSDENPRSETFQWYTAPKVQVP